MSTELVTLSIHFILCRPLHWPSSFPASGSFPVSWLFASDGQRTEASASASVLSMNIQGWFPLVLTWFDLAAQETLKSLLQHHNSKASILQRSAFFMVALLYRYITGKTIALTIWTIVGKVMSLLFNVLFGFVIAFLPKSKHLLILWLQSPSTVILEPKKIQWLHLKLIISTQTPYPNKVTFIGTIFPGGTVVKNSPAMQELGETWVWSLGWEDEEEMASPPRGGDGNPLQYSCLENPMDRGAWWATIHGVAKSRTQQSTYHRYQRLGFILGDITLSTMTLTKSHFLCIHYLPASRQTLICSIYSQPSCPQANNDLFYVQFPFSKILYKTIQYTLFLSSFF